MKPARSFASDNNAGVHPAVLKAIATANQGHVVGYGDDPYTASAVAKFREHFGREIEVFFVFNGTAANVLGLKALTQSYHAVICTEAALVGLLGGVLGLLGGHLLGALASSFMQHLIGEPINWLALDRWEWLYLLAVVVLALLAGFGGSDS